MLLAPAVFYAVIDRMVIPHEEETMERVFGQDYVAYKIASGVGSEKFRKLRLRKRIALAARRRNESAIKIFQVESEASSAAGLRRARRTTPRRFTSRRFRTACIAITR